jgi:hypothetical protein
MVVRGVGVGRILIWQVKDVGRGADIALVVVVVASDRQAPLMGVKAGTVIISHCQ